MSEFNSSFHLDLGPIGQAALGGAILSAAVATIWQLPAARQFLSNTDVKKAGLAFVASRLGLDGIGAAA
ncbi:hypothetical protein [Cryobacterium sp. Hz9]|uniref:hypothetical protein n=1 Tax=Cryobacterium sp. Hz9 TaxID=1259167 RepID=UPI001069A464|nr:hypothetical protein [Cryobacterium sp. Hz9]TFB66189.1 hypothetical protein E3N85_10125 [Cryobacterium sp. Hz9]